VSAETVIGSIGVALLLLAFLLNLVRVLTPESYPYTALNFAGASLAGFASYLIGFMPFVVLEGRFRVLQGETVRDVGPGAFVYGKPGEAHGFTNIGDSVGRLLVIDSPPRLEQYFRLVADHCANGTLTLEVQKDLYRQFDIDWVGPNLSTAPPPA